MHEAHVRAMEHDVEVLDGMDGLEGLPILEPDHLVRRHARAKGSLHECLDRIACLRCQIARVWVICKLKFGPHHQMNDVRVDPIGPVVVQDPDVVLLAVST